MMHLVVEERAGAAKGCLGVETVAAYVDGRLGSDQLARAERHIDGCRACRAELSEVVAVGDDVVPDDELCIETRTVCRQLSNTPVEASELELPEALGRYRVVRELGRGAMGVVVEAFDPQLARPVAIKVLRRVGPEARRRLLGEAQAMARLRHPNVVAVHDVGADGDTMFVAMELVAGVTLGALVAPWPERLAACVAAGRGLAAAHAAHLVHRDVKPANILCGASGDVRITDFGLACGSQAESGRDTREADFAGTPSYMAPELFVGGPATAQSDQFSLCVTIYECVYGRRPFPATSLADLRTRIEAGPRLPRATVVPPWIGAAIARGLSPDPAARFATTGDLLAALAQPATRVGRWLAAVASKMR